MKEQFIHNQGEDIKIIAACENLTGSYFTCLIRINFLAPDIIQTILLGVQPPTLNSATLLRHSSKLPLDWTTYFLVNPAKKRGCSVSGINQKT